MALSPDCTPWGAESTVSVLIGHRSSSTGAVWRTPALTSSGLCPGILGESQGSVIGQGAPMTLPGHILHVGGLGQRPHHQLSHIGLGVSAKEDDGQCLPGRWGAPPVQVGQGYRPAGQLQLYREDTIV